MSLSSLRLRVIHHHRFHRFARPLWQVAIVVGRSLGIRQSDERLASDSQRYWSGVIDSEAGMAHVRQGGVGDEVYRELGAQAVARIERFAGALGRSLDGLAVLEWGCGGGANLVALADRVDRIVGIDVAPDVLACARDELIRAGRPEAELHCIPVDAPEAALELLSDPVDLFICLYVIEIMPSTSHVRRVLRVARSWLRPGGMAIVQVKYRTTDPRTASRKFAYAVAPSSMTTFGIDEFWELAEAEGFVARHVELEPLQPLVNEEHYAYYLLTNP